jgi:1,4-dihydroxy-2-naphthoate octaprenyltransferase
LCIVAITQSLLVLVAGLAGIAGAWFYTAPPLKLAYRTSGEVTIAVLFGILPVCASYYIQAGAIDLVPVVPAVIAAILIFEVILANEFPDAPTDAAAGKRTIVVRFGALTAARIYTAAMLAMYAIGAVIFLPQRHLCPIWLSFMATAVLAAYAVYCLYRKTLRGLPQFALNSATIWLYHIVIAAMVLSHWFGACIAPIP